MGEEIDVQVQGWDICSCSSSLSLDRSICIYFSIVGVRLWDLFSQNSLDLVIRNQVFTNRDKFYLTTWRTTHFPWRGLSKVICIKRMLIPVWDLGLKLIPWWMGIGTGWLPSKGMNIYNMLGSISMDLREIFNPYTGCSFTYGYQSRQYF